MSLAKIKKKVVSITKKQGLAHIPFKQLPTKKTWEMLGLMTEDRKGVPFVYVSEEELKNSDGFVGLELESNFNPAPDHLRKVKDFFIEQKVVKVLSNIYSFQDVIRQEILTDCSPSIYLTPHYDGGGLECVLAPATELGHQKLKGEYEQILSIFAAYGFTDVVGGDGIHTNIDKTLFGSDETQRQNALINFFWFLFRECDFMVDISGRQFGYRARSDMYSLLGDALGNLTDKALERAFIREKDKFLAIFEKGSGRYLNIYANKDGRPTIEWRWFGSTLNITKFMATIELSYALPRFCRSISSAMEASLRNFCIYIKAKERRERYLHLIEVMRDNQHSTKYMNLTQTIPAVTVRVAETVAV